MQIVQDTTVHCDMCGTNTLDLMDIQEIYRGEAWKLVLKFALERHRGSAQPVRELFGLMGRTKGLEAAQAATDPRLP